QRHRAEARVEDLLVVDGARLLELIEEILQIAQADDAFGHADGDPAGVVDVATNRHWGLPLGVPRIWGSLRRAPSRIASEMDRCAALAVQIGPTETASHAAPAFPSKASMADGAALDDRRRRHGRDLGLRRLEG